MNTKTSWGLLALVILAVIFVPLIPNDLSIECNSSINDCDNQQAYVSLYTKLMTK